MDRKFTARAFRRDRGVDFNLKPETVSVEQLFLSLLAKRVFVPLTPCWNCEMGVQFYPVCTSGRDTLCRNSTSSSEPILIITNKNKIPKMICWEPLVKHTRLSEVSLLHDI